MSVQQFPNLNMPMVLADGRLTPVWQRFFDSLWGRTGGITSSVASFMATGQLMVHAGPSNPDVLSLLLCDGSEVSRADDAALFAVIGTTWGAGNGSTTFNLPNFAGRTLIGAGGVFPLGALGGAEEVTLAEGQLPAHTHAVTDPGHGHSVTDPGHVHTGATATPNSAASGVDVGSASGASTGSSTTGISVANATTGITLGDTGSGDPVSVMQPYAAVNVYIRR